MYFFRWASEAREDCLGVEYVVNGEGQKNCANSVNKSSTVSL